MHITENCTRKILEEIIQDNGRVLSQPNKNLVSRTKQISNFHKKAGIYYLLLQFMQNTCLVSPVI